MDVRPVNKGSQEVYSVKNRDELNRKYQNSSEEARTQKTAEDKLTLSDEAKKLLPVKQKVSGGFYDKPEVLNYVAGKLNGIYSPDKV